MQIESYILIDGEVVRCGGGSDCEFGARRDESRRGIDVWHRDAHGSLHEGFVSDMQMGFIRPEVAIKAWLDAVHELTSPRLAAAGLVVSSGIDITSFCDTQRRYLAP